MSTNAGTSGIGTRITDILNSIAALSINNRIIAWLTHYHERGVGYSVANININIDYDKSLEILNMDCTEEALCLAENIEGKWILTSNDYIVKAAYTKNGQKTQEAILPVEKNIDALRILCSFAVNQGYKLFTPVVLLLIVDGQEKNVKVDPRMFHHEPTPSIIEMQQKRPHISIYA